MLGPWWLFLMIKPYQNVVLVQAQGFQSYYLIQYPWFTVGPCLVCWQWGRLGKVVYYYLPMCPFVTRLILLALPICEALKS